MINWRTIVGFILLIIGIRQLYILFAGAAKATTTPLSAEIGCGVWMAVGIYFIIRGITMKKTNL